MASVNRLQQLLAELAPGQAKKDIAALQAKAISRRRASSRRCREDSPPRRRGRACQPDDDREEGQGPHPIEIKAIVTERGSNLMDLPGVGAVVAARILADVGDVARFADRNRFASWTGTAPLDASSGETRRQAAASTRRAHAKYSSIALIRTSRFDIRLLGFAVKRDHGCAARAAVLLIVPAGYRDSVSGETWVWVGVAVVVVGVLTLIPAIGFAKRLLAVRRALGQLGVDGKVAFYGALTYMIFPVDLFPDPIYLDDIGVLAAALYYLTRSLRERRAPDAPRQLRGDRPIR
ncbi:MAG TPA: IS110 family transposase [Jiangellaceae bacterium]